ncbi:MAG TPA: SUF system NifU family Fe-S cluster assembly protein [Actinomycetaceae bacterium]|nr:SUF system NifU family Fe-S cluster assembly protein [Actinomycetaceae bacterium]
MDNLESLYQQVIMDHARERHGSGKLAAPGGESFQVNPTCGDQATVQVAISHDAGEPRIAELAWDGVGCSISQASLSLMSDLVAGATLAEAEELGEIFREMMRSRGNFPDEKADRLEDASAMIGVSRYPARVKCALLGWMGLRGAVAEAIAGHGAGTTDTDHPKENR